MRWFILCLATASPAIACPVAGDLTTGILATSADGTTELYQHGTGDDVLVTATYSDGYQSANLLIHGAYVKQLASLTDGVLDIPTALRTDTASRKKFRRSLGAPSKSFRLETAVIRAYPGH